MHRTTSAPTHARAPARGVTASLTVTLLLGIGCATPQDLGAFAAPPGDAQSTDATTSVGEADPDAGFRFGAGLGAKAVESCPSPLPSAGAACAMQTGRECRYHDLDAAGPITTCGRSCVCGRDARWYCAPTTCAAVGARSCAEGVACAGDFACTAHCDTADAGCVSCRCEDGMLHCNAQVVVTPR